MRFLYILGAYKPKASANGICSENIIEQLIKGGHSVKVISNAARGVPEYSVQPDGVEVYRVKQRLYLRLKEYGEIKSGSVIGKVVLSVAFCINKLQLFFTAASWPVISYSTVNRFKKAALKLCEKEKFDAVISVYTPIESLLAGFEVKKKHPEIKFYPYFLDSLAFGYGPKYFGKEKTFSRGIAIEKKIFPSADKIILMKSSEDQQKKYNSEFSDKLCFLDIPMLKQCNTLQAKTVKSPDKIKLLFVGSVSSAVRNPSPLVSALAKTKNERLYCEFVGNIDCPQKFETLKKAFGERLTFSAFMPHEQLCRKLNEADVLLNIGNLVSTMVPSKIFEYMSYGKPIISTYEIDNEPSAEYLRSYPCALLLDGRNAPEENALKIEEFIENSVGKHTDFDELKKKFILNTPEEFVRAIGENEND